MFQGQRKTPPKISGVNVTTLLSEFSQLMLLKHNHKLSEGESSHIFKLPQELDLKPDELINLIASLSVPAT